MGEWKRGEEESWDDDGSRSRDLLAHLHLELTYLAGKRRGGGATRGAKLSKPYRRRIFRLFLLKYWALDLIEKVRERAWEVRAWAGIHNQGSIAAFSPTLA